MRGRGSTMRSSAGRSHFPRSKRRTGRAAARWWSGSSVDCLPVVLSTPDPNTAPRTLRRSPRGSSPRRTDRRWTTTITATCSTPARYGTDYGPGTPLKCELRARRDPARRLAAAQDRAPAEYPQRHRLVRAFIRFAHAEVGIRSELTQEALRPSTIGSRCIRKRFARIERSARRRFWPQWASGPPGCGATSTTPRSRGGGSTASRVGNPLRSSPRYDPRRRTDKWNGIPDDGDRAGSWTSRLFFAHGLITLAGAIVLTHSRPRSPRLWASRSPGRRSARLPGRRSGTSPSRCVCSAPRGSPTRPHCGSS